MSENGRNEGVVISGGNVTIGAMAVGPYAQAVSNAADALQRRGQDELAHKIQALLEALQQHEPELGDRDAAFSLTGRAAEELERDEPDKDTVLGFLGRVTAAAGSATAVAGAVTALQHAVMLLL